MNQSEAYTEGVKDWQELEPENPYEPGTQDYTDYAEGYLKTVQSKPTRCPGCEKILDSGDFETGKCANCDEELN